MNESIYEWEFSDIKNRWKLWYIIAISIVIWLSIWWILTKQFGLSFIVLLIAWVTLFIENNSEDKVIVKITSLWLKISDSFYDYTNIESYNFIYNWDDAIFIRLIVKKSWLKKIDLKINNIICSEIKNILPEFINENKWWQLTNSEKIINLLKL